MPWDLGSAADTRSRKCRRSKYNVQAKSKGTGDANIILGSERLPALVTMRKIYEWETQGQIDEKKRNIQIQGVHLWLDLTSAQMRTE